MDGVQKKRGGDVGSRRQSFIHYEYTQHVNVTCSHVSACNVGACKLSVKNGMFGSLRQLVLCGWVCRSPQGQRLKSSRSDSLSESVMDRKIVREYGYSSRNYCAVPRQPKGSATTDPSQFDSIAAKAEENKLHLLVEHLEQQVRSALSARTTATKGDLRVLKDAFAKFDHDQSGNVDFTEFRLAMEHLGLHVEGQGLAGKGGLPAQAMELLFAKYDTDQSGTVSYEEFAAQVLAEDNYPHL